MKERIGKKIKMVLNGNIFYSGVVIDEDEHFLVIKDKFDKEVTLGKGSITSMEVLE